VLANLESLAHTLGLKFEWVRVERSSGGNGFHIIARTVEPLSPVEQVAVQAIAGSDPRRERFNLMRARSIECIQGRNDWQFLFQEKLS
jgi:hypothetical protein